MKKVITFIADDGTDFDDEEECRAYEANTYRLDKATKDISIWGNNFQQIEVNAKNFEVVFEHAEVLEVRSIEAIRALQGVYDGYRWFDDLIAGGRYYYDATAEKFVPIRKLLEQYEFFQSLT